MANSNIENYIKKIMELQEAKQKISDDDLISIAKDLDFDIELINQAHKDCINRGTNFLKYKNFEDAKYEFEQASTLKPNDIETLFGLASAYAGRYEQREKIQDKEKSIELATKCLQIAPDYDLAARLISFLKQNRQALYEEESKQLPVNINYYAIGALIGFIMLAVIGFFIFLLLKGESNLTNGKKIIEQTKIAKQEIYPSTQTQNKHAELLVNGAKGYVFWFIYYIQERKDNNFVRSYYVDIIDVPSGNKRKKLMLAENLALTQNPFKEWIFMGNKLYTYLEAKKDVIGFDIYSGEIVDNKAILQNRFAELSEGIGILEFSHHSKYWLKIVLRSGKEFRYSPYFNKFYSEQKAKSIEKDYRNKEEYQIKSNWGIIEGEEMAKNIVFFQEKLSPFYFYGYRNDLINLREERLKSPNYIQVKKSENKFLSPKLLFGDENFALIYHLTEIGEDEKSILACVDAKTGKTKWEIKDLKKYIFFNDITKNQYNIHAVLNQNKDKIIMYNPYFMVEVKSGSTFFCCEIDVEKGKINWEKQLLQ
ncbi:MAG: hypothetical protein EAZ85_02730 [Bacteroidetes bacterium]|nr:MAG: hypothetical protein EAZ85_02730 [Bacteroidota bacterium]TAG85079.1 MAG: hypothetical protein EAZ20_16050 [Bacteroidota bacterium]